MPRIIDFGVAKATLQKLSAGTMYTRVGTIVGTLGYISPEQADSAGEDIDTRTDVYSLGVVLYELLVGALPLDFQKLAYDEVLRRLREQDAQRPSTKLSTLVGESAITAHNRGADPPTLVRQLRGDADSIALKALEKDRARRYATPSELAADIGRYLRNEPVSAHPPSTAYRARKYFRRHRLGVAMVAIAVLLLVGFAIVQAVQLRNIRRERDRADRIAQFMTGMFKVPNPSEARGNAVTAREILDKASSEIDTGLKNDPELQARMMYTMAWTYGGLGLFSREQSLFERALEIQQRILGSRHPDTLRTEVALAATLGNEGHRAEEEKLLRETLEIQRHVLGSEHRATLFTLSILASTLEQEGHYAAAEKLQREALDIKRRVLGPEDPDTLHSMNFLAVVLGDEGHYAESEKLQRETLDIRRRVLGPEHPDTLVSMFYLAVFLKEEGDYAEAEKQFREGIDVERRVLGPEHESTLISLENEAINLSYEGRYEDAEKILGDAIHAAEKSKDPRELANVWYAYACAAAVGRQRDEALNYLARAIDHGLEDPDFITSDPDLKSLHGDPRFEALIAKARQNATATGALPK